MLYKTSEYKRILLTTEISFSVLIHEVSSHIAEK